MKTMEADDPEWLDFMCRHIALKPYISIKSYGNSIQLNLERNRIVGGLPPPCYPLCRSILLNWGFVSYMNQGTNL